MKAISIKQPWATLIADGKKTVEVRTWSTKYRGDLLIVSSQKPAIKPAGCAVAVAELAECRPMSQGDAMAACCEVRPGAFAWVLKNVRRLDPFPLKGRLGIYEVEVPSAAGTRRQKPAEGKSLGGEENSPSPYAHCHQQSLFERQ